MDDRQKFDKLLQIYATIQPYRAPDFSNKTVLEYWYREFSQTPLDQMKEALDYWMRNESHFPSIADIRKSFGMHKPDPDVQSRQIAATIIAALAKFGWNREKEAKEALGPFIWQVVVGSGGWQTLTDMTYANQATITAQMRELAKSLIISQRFPSNEDNQPLLQDGARKALQIAQSSARSLDYKRIANSNLNPAMVESE